VRPRCRWCQAENLDGALTCATCHNPLSGDEAFAARCRNHPGVPAPTPCSRCGTFFCGQCLGRAGRGPGGGPGPWLCAGCQAHVGTLPWDERERLGLLRAWWQTSLKLITAPEATLARAGGEAPLSSSLLFAALSSLAGFGTTFVLYAVFGAAALTLGLQGVEQVDPGTGLLVAPVMLVGLFTLALAWQVVAVLFTAGLDQLGLRLLGVDARPYPVTVRANALSLGPYLLGLVPLCGLYVFPLWALVLRVLAVRALHGTTSGKAAAAVLLPSLLLCGLCGGAYALLLASALLTQS
jgi:hypothetical protein